MKPNKKRVVKKVDTMFTFSNLPQGVTRVTVTDSKGKKKKLKEGKDYLVVGNILRLLAPKSSK